MAGLSCESRVTWRVVGASVAGARHLVSGAACDDSHAYVRTDELLIVAVADGAGSAPAAATGSAVAVTAAAASLAGQLGAWPALGLDEARHAMCGAMVSARTALESRAQRQEIALGDLATTLLLALITADELVVAAIGDGAVVGRDTGGGLHAVAPVERGEYVNETTFVTSDGWLDALRLVSMPAPDAVALCTDGIELLAIETASGRPHRPFFDPLFDYVSGPNANQAELAEFLASDRVRSRTDDDCTLVIAVR